MDIVIFGIVALFFLVGLLGILLPALPGTGLIFIGILLYALYFGIETVGMTTLIALGGAALLAILFDYLAAAYGAKRFGGSGWGTGGAIFGGLIGVMVLNVIGLLVGIFVGAVLGELLGAKRDQSTAFRVGLGAVIGFLGGTLLKFILGLVMIGVFLFQVVR